MYLSSRARDLLDRAMDMIPIGATWSENQFADALASETDKHLARVAFSDCLLYRRTADIVEITI